MDNYGTNMTGGLIFHKVDVLPVWEVHHIGQLKYEISSHGYYLGGQTSTDNIDGWIPIGLNSGSIISSMINWDTEYTNDPNKVNAADIPATLIDVNSNVQDIIDSMSLLLSQLQDGTAISNKAIISRHVGFSSIDVPFTNINNNFTGDSLTLESVINTIAEYTSGNLRLAQSPLFGLKIGSSALTIQDALLDIELYLDSFNGNNISVIDPGTDVIIKLQDELDLMYTNSINKTFISLKDTPDELPITSKVVLCNSTGLIFADLAADLVSVMYPLGQTNNMQSALSMIQGQFNEFTDVIANLTFDASDITYDGLTFDNVDDTLDYLILNAFTTTKPPNATQISCTGFDFNNTVQAALQYVNEKIDDLIDSTSEIITAQQVQFDSSHGESNVGTALTYLYDQVYELVNKQVYTKLEIDQKFEQFTAQYYTSDECDDKYSLTTHTHDAVSVYSKSEADTTFAFKAHVHACLPDMTFDSHTHETYYTKSEIDAMESADMNASNYYTKSEVQSLIQSALGG